MFNDFFDILGIRACFPHQWGRWSVYENGRWRDARKGEWAQRTCRHCNHREEGWAKWS